VEKFYKVKGPMKWCTWKAV